MYLILHVILIVFALLFCILRITNSFQNIAEIMFFNVLGTIWAALSTG